MHIKKDPIITEVLIRHDQLKTIAVTCRCGIRSPHQIPTLLLTMEQRVIITCPDPVCGQKYGVAREGIIRLTPDMQIDHSNPVLIRKSATVQPISHDQPNQKVDTEIIDSEENHVIPQLNATLDHDDINSMN